MMVKEYKSFKGIISLLKYISLFYVEATLALLASTDPLKPSNKTTIKHETMKNPCPWIV